MGTRPPSPPPSSPPRQPFPISRTLTKPLAVPARKPDAHVLQPLPHPKSKNRTRKCTQHTPFSFKQLVGQTIMPWAAWRSRGRTSSDSDTCSRQTAAPESTNPVINSRGRPEAIRSHAPDVRKTERGDSPSGPSDPAESSNMSTNESIESFDDTKTGTPNSIPSALGKCTYMYTRSDSGTDASPCASLFIRAKSITTADDVALPLLPDIAIADTAVGGGDAAAAACAALC